MKRRILHCIQYDLSEYEALEWLLQRHCRVAGLNDYSRIMLAWDLAPALVEKARANRQLGGREKGWSNLTKAEQVHVRSEIAKAAVVSTGNVTKVKQLNETCAPELIAALYSHEISIHWAWKLRNESPEDQLDALGRFRFEKGILKDVRKLAATRRRTYSAAAQDPNELVSSSGTIFEKISWFLSDIAVLAASVIRRWVQANYRVMPIVIVIPHTFGRRLNFHPHLHILISAGGLNKRENRWIHFRHIDKYALMYWWRFAVVRYLAEVLGLEVEDMAAFDGLLNEQGRRPLEHPH